jgi:hypothetical protein
MNKHHLGKAALALVGTAAFLAPLTWTPQALAWDLVSSDTQKVFVPDVYQGRKLANTSVATRYVGAGTKREDGARLLVGKTPREVLTDIKNPSRETLDNGIYAVYKLVRADKWNDVQYKTPWTLYDMKQKQSQTTSFFVFEWKDGVNNTVIRNNDPNFEIGPWLDTGAPEKDAVAGTGADLWPELVKEDFRSENREVQLARVPLSLASNEAAKAKSALFLSDSGNGGGSTSVSGSQKRATFKADEAVVSETKKPAATTEQAASNTTAKALPTPTPVATPTPSKIDNGKAITMDDWIGTWTSKGKSGNAYDYQLVIAKYSAKNVKYTFDSWFNVDAFDKMGPTDYSTNGTFVDDKKTAYKDTQGTVNCDLRLVRENGLLRLSGTVTLRQMDWYGNVKASKTYSVNLTK